MSTRKFLFTWRETLLSPSGPRSAIRRLVLLVLSTDADTDGASCHPSTRRLAERTGLSRRRVEDHLREAEGEGWIRRTPKGTGQGWRRMAYTLTVPANVGTQRPQLAGQGGDDPSAPSSEDVETERPHPATGTWGRSRHERGDVGDMNVGTERPLTSVVTSEKTSLFDDDASSVSVEDRRDFPTLAKLARRGRERIYPPEFEGAFAALPARHVPHAKAAAYSAWRSRTNDVEELFQLEAAADAYREDCERQGKAGTEFVLMASTFFGPGERWRPYLGRPVGAGASPADDFARREAERFAELERSGGVRFDA